MLKCSRCRHIFPADRTQRGEAEADEASEATPAAAPPSTAPAPAPGQKDLDLQYDEPSGWSGEQPELPSFREDEDYSLGAAAEPTAERGREIRRGPRIVSEVEGAARGSTARRDEKAADYSFDDEEIEDEEREEADEDEDEEVADDEMEAEDEEGDELASEVGHARDDDVKRSRRGLVPLALFFSIVVSVYFFLSQELIRDRDFAERFIARLPMVGSSLAADRLLFRKVALTGVEGSFLRVKQGKEVFVISGTALNTASRPLRNIRVEGTLSDAAGRPLQQEAITCGGMDARRLLQGLSLREVEMLGQVVPSNKFRLEPGDSTTFAIVFTNPPAGAAEFSARVASAQR